MFTNLGRVYWLKIYNIPDVGSTGRGRNIVNVIDLQPGETVQAFRPVKSFDADKFIVMATKKGHRQEVLARSIFAAAGAVASSRSGWMKTTSWFRPGCWRRGRKSSLATRNGQAGPLRA